MVQLSNGRSKFVRKRLDILRRAASEFRRRGFEATGMREIAAAVDLQPGTLYHYFANKEDILFFCQDWSLDRMLESAARAAKLDAGPAEKLRAVIVGQMRCMLDELRGSAAHVEMHGLSGARRAALVAKRDRYERAGRRVVSDGMRSGAFVRGDAKLVALAVLGAINWSIRWYRPDGPKGVEEIAAVFADYLVRGLEATRAGRRT